MSTSKSNKPSLNKDFLLNDSKTFCMFPWVHVNTDPTGIVFPCCVATIDPKDRETVNGRGLNEIANIDNIKQLRLDMLNEVTNPICQICTEHEKFNIHSVRKSANQTYGKYIDAVDNTNEDGSLSDFKMYYFDMRFNNICNFKCRTCNSHFSSQWEQENIRNGIRIDFNKSDTRQLLQDCIKQIPHMETAYFAGGEPLITEEHYILLEEMIKQGRTDINLVYNTNLSGFKFKGKHVFDMWDKFKNPVNVCASIDHYGARAEYIRHGTVWDVVEANYKSAMQQDNINLSINTVYSIFNALTIDDFYRYLIDQGMYSNRPSAPTNSLNCTANPKEIACHALPAEYKDKARRALENTVQLFVDADFTEDKIQVIKQAIAWLDKEGNEESDLSQFRKEVRRIDKIRNENFKETFPELQGLLDE